MPEFLKAFFKKYNIGYSRTTLNENLVNCHCSLDSFESSCNNCEKCFDNDFNPVYLIHGKVGRSNAKKLIEKWSKEK